jgi:nitroreductase
MSQLDLSSDQLLSTTRAVRKRLDFDRPVEDELIRECVAMAMQSPSGSNSMTMQFVVVTDPAKRAAIGEIYGKCFDIYRSMDGVYAGSLKRETVEGQAQQDRVTDSAEYLAAHMGEAPALVIACTQSGRLDGAPAMSAASSMGNVLPARDLLDHRRVDDGRADRRCRRDPVRLGAASRTQSACVHEGHGLHDSDAARPRLDHSLEYLVQLND